MPVDIQSSSLCIGIVGTGAMGRGIAQIAAQAGIRVLLFDALHGAAANARETVVGTLGKLAEKGKISAEALAAATAKLEVVPRLDELASAQVIIEAIVENLDVKKQLFQQLEDIIGADCILATNTSSLSVTSLAAACKRPERVGGFHFFNPVPLMKIVEVIDGLLTAPWVCEALLALGRRMGHTAVAARDTPGFIVNHAGRGFATEALRILGEGVTDFWEIDRIMREVAGFRMGPFELLDLTGLDVSQPVMESIYHQYYQEPRYRPSALAAQRLAGGLLGRKTGRGFYTYANGTPEAMPVAIVPTAKPASVWVSQTHPAWGETVREIAAAAGIAVETDYEPSEDALCIITPLGMDATTACVTKGLDPGRTVAIDCLFGITAGKSPRRTLMTTPLTTPAMRDAAHALFAADGTPVTVIHDSAGFVAQRIVACIVNIGCDIAQQRVAKPADIDRAVTLGLAYPKGPLAFGDALGARNVLTILEAMQDFYGDPRYRPSPWLKRRALLGVSLLTDEA
ncbi:MAG: 3-hydroxybutyryl-CoA dehydrogenase [Rhodocyclaceae bacterium]|nr:MAG: 3-hydroxybutyryl-CoA dehydrogenase [Rhodocyclaceae bacterium]TND02775.1 MAG: 3-hydroxybutyryl-CoA dehydrogenase [Rhodocyclaceae bacterium]